MSHLYLDANELDAAARRAVAEAGRRIGGVGAGPVAVLVAEVDRDAGKTEADPEAWSSDHVDALNKELVEMIGASIRGDDLVGRLGGRVVMILTDAGADDARVRRRPNLCGGTDPPLRRWL